MITLRHLRYFEALARHRNFGRAAEACAVSQPALSMQIQDMEQRLGTPLLERRRGDVRLTPLGEEIARRAQVILLQVKDLDDVARRAASGVSGDVVLGAIPSVAPYLLPATLPLLRQRFPALKLTLRETQTATLINELLAGQLDMLLLALPVDETDIEVMALFDDPFVLAVPAAEEDGRAAAAEPIQPDAIPADRVLLLEEGHCFRDQALAVCGKGGEGRAQFGASSLATLVQLVANGYGMTLLPMLAVPVEVANDTRIVLRELAPPAPQRTIGLAWRRASPRASEFRTLEAVFRDAR